MQELLSGREFEDVLEFIWERLIYLAGEGASALPALFWVCEASGYQLRLFTAVPCYTVIKCS